MSIQDVSEAVRKYWAVAVAVCIVIVPSMWFLMDYLHKTRIEERDAKIRALEQVVRRGAMDRKPEVATQQPEAQGPSEAASAVPGEVTGRNPALIAGRLGVSTTWGSGWLDLSTATDFAPGDRLSTLIHNYGYVK